MANPAVDLRIRHWTREDYERMAEQGFFRPDERVELVDGVIFEMTPQNSWHAAAIQAAQEVLHPIFRKGYSLRIQMPLALGLESEPEPDLAVVRGHWRDYRDSHPTTAVLILEIADSTVFHDRERKSALYARVGIPDYWILNRADACLEVQRDPRDGKYQTRRILSAGDSISPLARTEASILVADLDLPENPPCPRSSGATSSNPLSRRGASPESLSSFTSGPPSDWAAEKWVP